MKESQTSNLCKSLRHRGFLKTDFNLGVMLVLMGGRKQYSEQGDIFSKGVTSGNLPFIQMNCANYQPLIIFMQWLHLLRG